MNFALIENRGEDKKNSLQTEDDFILIRDAQSLFSRKFSGHMGRWYYCSGQGSKDSADGVDLWRKLAEGVPQYGVSTQEEDVIQDVAKMLSGSHFSGTCRSALDIGPGGLRSISRKTLPVLSVLKNLEKYTAIDISDEFAQDAVTIVGTRLHVKVKTIHEDVFRFPFLASTLPKFDLAIAFGIIPNVIAPAGGLSQDPLIKFFLKIKNTLTDKGIFVASYCTEDDEKEVIHSYETSENRGFCLSPMYQIDRIAIGDFSPQDWRYKPVWHERAKQCCHMVYPTRNQRFEIFDQSFSVCAGEMFHLSNSYRFSDEFITECLATVGFSKVGIYKKGKISVFSAQK